MMLSAALLLFTAVGILKPTHVAGFFQCDRDMGPAGNTGCIEPDILSPNVTYSAPQYATCLTDAYIQQVSKGKHKCIDRTRTYCYYQCMIEVHGKENGTVTPDCVCDPDNTTVLQNVAGLGPQCFSPNGSDCGWYRDCLEKRYDCRNTSDSSVVSYAEKFCTVFLERSKTLSADGQRWMDQARKCLQVQLVPLLRPFEQVTCSGVKQRAIQSQAACYLQPFAGAPSVCDLLPADFWRVFWALKGAFAAGFKESLVGVLKIADGCATSQSGTADRNLNKAVDGMTQISVGVPLTFQSIRNIHDQQPPSRNKRWADIASTASKSSVMLPKLHHDSSIASKADPSDAGGVRQVDAHTAIAGVSSSTPRKRRVVREASVTWEGETDEEMYYHDLAETTAAQMAEQLGWEERGVTWFAYARVTGNDTLMVNILLADEQAFDLGNKSTTTRPNLTEVVEQVAQAFEEGEIIISFNGTQVQVETFSACGDVRCDDVYLNVTVPPPVAFQSSTEPDTAGNQTSGFATNATEPDSTSTPEQGSASGGTTAWSDFQATVVLPGILAVAYANIICGI